MDIDQRLEFLVQSTESLHASVQELSGTVAGLTAQIAVHSAAMVRLETREHKAHIAMLSAIKAYLEVMNDGNGSEGSGQT